MNWSSKLDFYYKLQADGNLRPEDVAPNVDGFDLYVKAFRELNTCRPSGFGVAAIPFTAIVEYAKVYGIPEEDFDEFLYVIRRMDEVYTDIESKKQGSKSGNTTNS